MAVACAKSSVSSTTGTAFLLVCVSLSVWIIADTLLVAFPTVEIERPSTEYKPKSSELAESIINDRNEHLWWMLQISDIHVSSYRNFHIPDNLRTFLMEVIPAVNPRAVVATGDLTDAKKTNMMYSGQEISEWQVYKNLLDDYLKNGKSRFDGQSPLWIDIPGNHDKFDVPSESKDLYRKYSPFSNQWQPGKRHLVHKFVVNNTGYAIVAIDATPNPGFKRPYNFFGLLSDETLHEFKEVDERLRQEGVETAIWAGHYPGSIIFVGNSLSNRKKLLDGNVIRQGSVYLCGHLHSVHNAEFALYTRHPPLGQLELELADFQRSERFRIFALDHGLFSFTDVSLNEWPVVLVTNPKEGLTAMPNYEPLGKIATSTHIRILAFSNVEIQYVLVAINGQVMGNATRHASNSNLYTLPWNPKDINDRSPSRFSRLEVTVADSNKRTKQISVYFLIDPKAADLLPVNIGGSFASLILLSDVPKICRNAFVGSTLFCLVLCLCARYQSTIFVKFSSFRGFVSFCQLLPFRLFVFICLTITYPVIGPWNLCEIASGHYAFVFGHGILLTADGTFIPDAVTSFHGLINVLTFLLPVLLYFGWLFSYKPYPSRRRVRISQRLLFQFLIVLQMWNAYSDAQSYGWWAFFVSPMRTWTCLVLIYFDVQCRKIVKC